MCAIVHWTLPSSYIYKLYIQYYEPANTTPYVVLSLRE